MNPDNRTQAELRADLAESETLCLRLAELLTGVAAGLKGEPGPLHLHDWSDLPSVAAAMREQLDAQPPSSHSSTTHLVAYVGAGFGSERAWRCQRCPGVWPRWAQISGRCPAEEEQPPCPDCTAARGHRIGCEWRTVGDPLPPPTPREDHPEMTAETPPAPTVGAADPLSAAYCAERAARALHLGEASLGLDTAQTLLRAAEQWTALGAAIASNPQMQQRPAG